MQSCERNAENHYLMLRWESEQKIMQKGHFWIWKGHFCIVYQKVGAMVFLAPGSYVPELCHYFSKWMPTKYVN